MNDYIIDNIRKEISENSKIYDEYIDVMNLWKDVTKYIEKLCDEYRKYPSISFLKEIEIWKLQEQDYFNLFNEYQQKIKIVNSDRNFEEKKEFIKLFDLFNELNKEIKSIENKSKKFGSKKQIGTNRVETFNAEGRKKYIHEYLLRDYNILVNKKKEILPRYRELYKKYIDNSYNILENSSIDIDNKVIIYDDEGIKLEEKYFNSMSLDEKIDYYNKRIDNIINAKNTGKKVRIRVYGKSYYVPKKYEHLVKEYLREINKLYDYKQVSSDTNNISLSSIDSSFVEQKVFNNDIVVKSENKNDNTIDNVDIDNNFNEIVSFIKEKNTTNNKEFVISNVDNVYDVDDIRPINVEFKDVSSNYSNSSDDRDIWSDASMIPKNNKNKNDNNIIEVKPTSIINVLPNSEKKEIILVKNVKKPKNKLGLRKKIIAAAAAIALALTTAISVFGLSNLGQKNDKKSDDNNSKVVTEGLISKFPVDNLRDEIVQSINKDKSFDKKDDTIEDSVINNNDSKFKIGDTVNINNNDSKFKIGDTVNINNNSFIYDNVYDAMNKENGLKPYYDENMDRNVTGLFVNCDGNYIYSEDQSQVDKLLSDGGVIESVVVGEYEGAYNYNDVKLKLKVR